jgi:hypothetical protein
MTDAQSVVAPPPQQLPLATEDDLQQAEYVAKDEHPDHQLWIDRGPTSVGVMRRKGLRRTRNDRRDFVLVTVVLLVIWQFFASL